MHKGMEGRPIRWVDVLVMGGVRREGGQRHFGRAESRE